MSWLDPFLQGYATIKRATVAVTQRKILNLSSYFTVTDNAATGATDLGPNLGSTQVPVRLILVLNESSTETSGGSSASVGGRVLATTEYLTGATNVTLYAAVGRAAGGATTMHVQLYNETDSASVVETTTTDAFAELSLDASAIIGLGRKLYNVRFWAEDAGTNVMGVGELRIS